MTMTELILNALKNFATANQNSHQRAAGSEAAARMATGIAERLEIYGELTYNEIRQLAKMPNVAPGTHDAIEQINTMLFAFVNIAKAMKVNAENAKDTDWPIKNTEVFSSKELNMLPAIKNWTASKEWIYLDDNNKPIHEAYRREQEIVHHHMTDAVDESITKLVNENNVWNGSQQYNDFLRAMRELQAMKDAEGLLKPRENAEVGKKYAEVLRLGQAYLNYKAGDRRSINQNGLKRIKAVNEIVNKLGALQMEEESNYNLSMGSVARERAKAAEDNRKYQQKLEEMRLENARTDEKLAAERAEKQRIKEANKARNEKNYNAVAENPELVVKAVECLFDRKKVLSDEYVDAYQQFNAYQSLKTKKGFKQVEHFVVSNDDLVRIHGMFNLRTRLLSEENKKIPPNEAKLGRTLGDLYEIYIASDYLKNKNRKELVHRSNDEENKLYHDLEKTRAFKEYGEKILAEGGSEEYSKLLNDPKYQEKKIRELTAEGVKELRVVNDDLKKKIEYLKNYRNVMKEDYNKYTEELTTYIKRSKEMDVWLGKPARKDSEIARDECGLSEMQYQKISELGSGYGASARWYYNSAVRAWNGLMDYPAKGMVSTLYDIQYHPAFDGVGNEEPLPNQLGSLERNGYLMELDGVKEMEKKSLAELDTFIHKPDEVEKLMDALHTEVQQKGLLSEETMERERNELAASVKYLLDYKNALYPKYVEERRKLDAHLNKAEALNKRAEELKALGLSEEQDKKIKLLSGDVMKDFREHMGMSWDDIAQQAKKGYVDPLKKTLGILGFMYFTKCMNEPGNILPVPETGKDMEKAASAMGKKLMELPEMKTWLQNDKQYWDLTTPEGCQNLVTLHTDQKQQMKFMDGMSAVAKKNGLFGDKEPAAGQEYPKVQREQRKSIQNQLG